MTKIQDAWPLGWTGNGIIDCGDNGRMSLSVDVDDGFFGVAKQNLELILEKWPILWPEILLIAQKMLDEYEHPLKIANPGASIQICIPSAIISDGVEWSVAIKFSGYAGDWAIAVNGWTPDPEECDPTFNLSSQTDETDSLTRPLISSITCIQPQICLEGYMEEKIAKARKDDHAD